MRHNGRPSIALSSLATNLFTADWRGDASVRVTVVCRDCGCFRTVKRGMVFPHRYTAQVAPGSYVEDARCPGSGQRITVDVTPAEWADGFRNACQTTERRRSARTLIKPGPAPATPLHRIAAAR